MKILAIDPGPKESAFVTWNNGKLGYCDIKPNEFVRNCLAFLNPAQTDVVAIEMVACFGMPVGREVFETCLWVGRFMERSPIGARLVYRSEVKMHHCHSMRAKDANVNQALRDKYGDKGTKKNPGLTYWLRSHLWSAFAIATYISETVEPVSSPAENLVASLTS